MKETKKSLTKEEIKAKTSYVALRNSWQHRPRISTRFDYGWSMVISKRWTWVEALEFINSEIANHKKLLEGRHNA